MENQAPEEKVELKDLNYRFVDLNGKSVSIANLDNVVAYVDDKILNETKLTTLFKKIKSTSPNRIRGYSILQLLNPKNGNLYTDDENVVQFLDTSSKVIFTLKKELPYITSDNITITQNEAEGYVLLILYKELKEEIEDKDVKAAVVEEVTKLEETKLEEETEPLTEIEEEKEPDGKLEIETKVTEIVTETKISEEKPLEDKTEEEHKDETKTPDENLKQKFFKDKVKTE